MHGLIIKALEHFLRDYYDQDLWPQVLDRADTSIDEFEPFRIYPTRIGSALVVASASVLGKTVAELLEDLGAYLVTHPNRQNIRRLLRFGGESFLDFLYSLPELKDRVTFAIGDIDLPEVELREHFTNSLSLTVHGGPAGAGHVLAGLLRALADDYGALVLLDYVGRLGRVETLSVRLLDLSFAAGQDFDLAARAP